MKKTTKKTPNSVTLNCDAVIEIEAAADGQPAKRPTFSISAYNGGAVRVGGFYRPVVIDLAGVRSNATIPVLLDHDHSQIVGQADQVQIKKTAVILSGVVTGDDEPARKVVSHARNGFKWAASVGVGVERLEHVDAGSEVKVNGHKFPGPVSVVRAGRLGEVSFVAVGADETAAAEVAASANSDKEVNLMSFEKWLEAKGFDAATLTGEQRQALQAAYDAEQGQRAEAVDRPSSDAKPDGAVEDVVAAAQAQARAAAKAETERVAAIRQVCGGKYAEIEAKAIDAGWSAERTELEVLRASRPKSPAIHASDPAQGNHVLEAACMLSAKYGEPERLFDAPTLDAAAKRFRGGIGLQELLLEAACANGYTGRNFRDHREVLRYAFRHNLQAGFSTIDIGGILSNVANRFLLEGFFSVERTWRNICAIRNFSDFKEATSYRLIGKDQYEPVAPGGELKHGTLGEETYTNKVDTYGLMLTIDRRDIVNDDLGAITLVPRKLGRGSGLKVNDVFWREFLDNATFFSGGNDNFIDGADSALGINALTLAEVKFLNQTDSDGKPIGVMPAVVLVPTALSAMATVLYKSLEIRETTASTKYPVANPHAGKFRVEVSRYLSNAQYAGNSDKAWYLLADPNDLPVIEVAFLNGQEAPTIETAEADFNVLGVQMRGFHDFGARKQDPRGGVKVKGEA